MARDSGTREARGTKIRVTVTRTYEASVAECFPDGVPEGAPAGYAVPEDETARAVLWLDWKMRHDPFEPGSFEKDFAEAVVGHSAYAARAEQEADRG